MQDKTGRCDLTSSDRSMEYADKHRLNSLAHCLEHSKKTLDSLRRQLRAIEHPALCQRDTVLVCGSYGRREASEHSDIDYFMVYDGKERRESCQEFVTKVANTACELGLNAPASDGPFAKPKRRDSIVRNIGGNKDSNEKITRRVLLLLEGDWLLNKEGFRSLRKEILECYVREEIPDHHVTLFLLNDIIRYWRTVCVDYEYKTRESGKSWAIRNVKLVFSRKLLYASGLFSVARTADLSRERKLEELESLFDLSPLDRLVEICGVAATVPMLRSYDAFLACVGDKGKRECLDKLGPNERDDPIFREIKNEGYRFTRELLKLFEGTFHSSHPIRRAIVY